MKEAGIPPGPLMHDILTKVIARIKRDGLMPEKPNLREKVKGIRSYFEKEYDYHIGIEFETDSPIWEFLTRKKHGHCELFASAGVMLLRKMGVPARYVTGFVCAEPNPYDKTLWVARNKHAHAWVEYFDSDRGWQIAEFTPPSGMPQVGQLEGRDAFWEYLRSLWSRAYSFFRREGIGGLLTLALTFFAAAGNWVLVSWWRIAAAVILFALFFYYRMFAGKRRRKDIKEKPRQFPEDIGQMREAFLRLEKDFRKAGMGRADSETLDEYAARIEVSDLEGKAEAADFVRKYSAARYQPF
jgi:hypothetical protein